MAKKFQKKDISRISGAAMILFGRIVLVTSFLFTATLLTFGTPATVTPTRLLVFLIVGLSLGVGGFRFSSGTWSGSWQILHWSAAISGVFFIASTLSHFLFSSGAYLAFNRGALGLFTVISAVSLVSWLIRTRAPHQRRRTKANTIQTNTAEQYSGHEEELNADLNESIAKEIFSEGYFERARIRAQRRKSPLNLLLIPSIVIPLGLLWWFGVIAAELLHLKYYPRQYLSKSQGLGTIFVAISPFFGAIPLAMIIGNFLVWLIPPVRQVLEDEARPFPSTKYKNAQKQLFKLALFFVPISLLFAIIGAFLEWR